MIRFFFFLIPFIFAFRTLHAQDVRIDIRFNGEPFDLDKKYSYQGETISFSTVKFYISNIQLAYKDPIDTSKMGVTLKQPSAHLIDLEKKESLKLSTGLQAGGADQFSFNIGIDSTQSISGAFPGDLDPTNGMYWAWQSGYINCKIEGTSPLCPARKNKFQFHLGGYAYPNNCLQEISLQPNKKTNELIIRIELADFIEGINIKKQFRIMSPSLEAVNLSKLFSKTFSYYEEK